MGLSRGSADEGHKVRGHWKHLRCPSTGDILTLQSSHIGQNRIHQ